MSTTHPPSPGYCASHASLRSSTQWWVAAFWMLQSATVLPSVSCLPTNMTHYLSRGHVQKHSQRNNSITAQCANGLNKRPRRQWGLLKTPFWWRAVAAFSIITTDHCHKGQSIQNAFMAMAPQGQTAANSTKHSQSMSQARKRAR